MSSHLDGELSERIELLGCVPTEEQNLAAFQSFAQPDHHLPAQRTVWLVDAGRVDQNDLRAALSFAFTFGNIDHALNPVARGLRLGRNDGELFTHESIKKR